MIAVDDAPFHQRDEIVTPEERDGSVLTTSWVYLTSVLLLPWLTSPVIFWIMVCSSRLSLLGHATCMGDGLEVLLEGSRGDDDHQF